MNEYDEMTLKVMEDIVDGKKILAGINRRVRIIAWLLPRFHKGLSDPRKYQELVGRIDE